MTHSNDNNFTKFSRFSCRNSFFSKEKGGPKNNFDIGYTSIMMRYESVLYEARIFFESNDPIISGQVRKVFIILLDSDSVNKFSSKHQIIFDVCIPRKIGYGKILLNFNTFAPNTDD